MPRPSLRDALVEEGTKVLHANGYAGAGVAEITTAANAPKGSFYNHFASKEAFAAAALQDYFDGFGELFEATVGNDALSGLARLEALAAGLEQALARSDYQGCLIGVLALEAGGRADELRRAVNQKFGAFRAALATAMADGQRDGSLATRLSPEAAAGIFLSAFEGAALRARAERDGAPLIEFRDAVRGLFGA